MGNNKMYWLIAVLTIGMAGMMVKGFLVAEGIKKAREECIAKEAQGVRQYSKCMEDLLGY